ncbi:MAG TPA: DNA gyrase inhibitor YacG [Candidatus Kryptonia bacterium]|nr:DNA gyrase inhibitor YacG [Candidatus Kryptonia bacterium]
MPERVRCPTCRNECAWVGNPHRPFCSERCRLLDLSNWIGERYRIPGATAGDESDNQGDADDE